MWAFVSGSVPWLAAAGAHLGLMTIYLLLVYHWSAGRPLYGLLAPLWSPLMLAILGYSLHKCRTGRIMWRDTEFAMPAPPGGDTV
jgi:hypothetical protein